MTDVAPELLLGEKRRKTVDNVIHELGETFQRFEDRLSWKRRVLAERYREGSVKLLAELDVVHRGQRKQIQAIFNRADPEVAYSGDGAAIRACDLKAFDSGVVGRWNEGYVFVGNVQVMDGAERLVPSFVRLQRADYLEDIFSGSVYVSALNGVLKAVDPLREREIDILSVFAIESDEIAGQEIERGSHVMDGIADDPCELLRHFLPDPQLPEVLRGVRVLLDHDSIRVTTDVRDDFVVQVSDVALGATNL